MVDPASDKVSRASPYSGTVRQSHHHFVYGDFTLFVLLSQNSSTMLMVFHSVPCGQTALQPRSNERFRLLRFRSPLLSESLLISFPALLRWFTSRSIALPPYFIQARSVRISPDGLPHSAIPGSQDMCSSPGLFAAYHGLLRLRAPKASTINLIFA